MAVTTTYQCPNCNGRLNFDGAVGKLRCEFCGSTFTPEEVEQIYAAKQEKADAQAAAERRSELRDQASLLSDEQKAALEQERAQAIADGDFDRANEITTKLAKDAIAADGVGLSAAEASTSDATRVQARQVESTGDPVQDYLAQAKWDSSETDNLRAFNCPACGAQLLVDQVTAVTSCPYCGNNAVVPGQLSDVLKPDYVIPFKLSKEDAIAGLKNYYSNKKLLPNTFTAENHLQEIQGVYVPFWLYSGTATGNVTLNGRNIRTWADHKNNYTETDHWLLHRVGTMDFKLVPVDGSTKMPDAHMDAIEPFDYSEMVPFSVAYLPGYITDRYDLDVKQCDERARKRVANTCVDAIESTVGGYMEIDVAHADSDVQWTNVAYALLPVWMLHTRWNDEDFLFAMNGQTGRLIGDLPVDRTKAWRNRAAVFFPLLILIAVIVIFLFGGFGM